MKTLLLKETRIVRFVDVREGVTYAMISEITLKQYNFIIRF